MRKKPIDRTIKNWKWWLLLLPALLLFIIASSPILVILFLEGCLKIMKLLDCRRYNSKTLTGIVKWAHNDK